jgi:uncharacterized membrane protein
LAKSKFQEKVSFKKKLTKNLEKSFQEKVDKSKKIGKISDINIIINLLNIIFIIYNSPVPSFFLNFTSKYLPRIIKKKN